MEEKSVLTGPFCQLTELSFLMQLKCSCQKILLSLLWKVTVSVQSLNELWLSSVLKEERDLK